MGLSPADLTQTHLNLIRSADLLVAGKRHLEYFKDIQADKREIDKNLKGLIEDIRKREDRQVVVIASGDPLFFGIGNFLIRELGKDQVIIYPNITTVAGAFARMKESWQNAEILSMHGRSDESELLNALYQHDKIAIFTSPDKNPSWIAEFLIGHRIANFEIWVFEQLGSSDEKVASYSPEQAENLNFSEPNLVVLRRISQSKCDKMPLHLGMSERSYLHHNENITKSEVRAISLAKLKLDRPDYVLWDLGAGSGSVSLEASLFLRRGQIISIEQKSERVAQIRENAAKFGVRNIEVIQAALPDGLDKLPKPDRIFIGGGGKEIGNIIRTALPYLKPDGVLVINTVLLQSLHLASESLELCGYDSEVVQIQISRSRKMPWGERLDALNPVWIISAERSKTESL